MSFSATAIDPVTRSLIHKAKTAGSGTPPRKKEVSGSPNQKRDNRIVLTRKNPTPYSNTFRRAYYTLSLVEWIFIGIDGPEFGLEPMRTITRIRKRIASLTPLLLDGERTPILRPKDHKRHHALLRRIEKITRQMVTEIPRDFVPFVLLAVDMVDHLFQFRFDPDPERRKHWTWLLKNLVTMNHQLEARMMGLNDKTYGIVSKEMRPFDPGMTGYHRTETWEVGGVTWERLEGYGLRELDPWMAEHHKIMKPKYETACRYAERIRREIERA